jgi:hypothetical protein
MPSKTFSLFVINDIDSFEDLLAQHKGEVAVQF